MFKCDFCGKELNTQGGKNLHEYRCSEKPSARKENKGCNHAWRVLNNRELSVLQSNGIYEYVEVCTVCDTLQ